MSSDMEVEMAMEANIPGIVEIDEGVIQDMIGYVALTNYGVAGMASPSFSDGIATMLPMQKLRRGIKLKNNGESVDIELFIIVQDGTNLSVVSENLADTVRYALKEYLGVPVGELSINIQGVKA